MSDKVQLIPEEHNEDLEEEIDRYLDLADLKTECIGITSAQDYFDDITKTAHHFIEWQKQKDLEDSLKSDMTMPNKFYEKGRFDMREEMMKNAVEGEVVYQIGSAEIAPTDIKYKVVSDRVYIPNVKLGDKVQLIIVKSEQQ